MKGLSTGRYDAIPNHQDIVGPKEEETRKRGYAQDLIIQKAKPESISTIVKELDSTLNKIELLELYGAFQVPSSWLRLRKLIHKDM